MCNRFHGVLIRLADGERRAAWIGRTPREILQRIGYGEGEGVRHNPELDRETPGRLSVHLNLDLGRAVGCALQGACFEKPNVSCAAQLPGPNQRHVSEVTPGAARSDERELEFRSQEVGFRRDFEWSAVVFGAAHDHKRRIDVHRIARHRRSKQGEIVFCQLAKAFLPVGENARLLLDPRVHRGNQRTVRSGASNAQEIARFAAGLFRDGKAEGNAPVRRMHDEFGGARQIPRQRQFLREDIGGPGRQNGKRHLAASQSVHDFIYRAVAPADDHELPRFIDRAARDCGCLAGSRSILKLRFDSGVVENAARLIQLPHGSAAAGSGIDDQNCIANLR